MTDALWALVLGPLMWVPGLNILVGFLAFGWGGALLGLVVTVLRSAGGERVEAARENVREQAKQSTKKAARKVRGWWTELGVKPDASREEINRAYRDRAKKAHPDAGGSDAKMTKLNAAREAALRDRGR